MEQPPQVVAVTREVCAEIKRQDMTYGTLSTTTGMSVWSLSRRLNGHKDFTLSELSVIADALGIPFGEFFARANRHAA